MIRLAIISLLSMCLSGLYAKDLEPVLHRYSNQAGLSIGMTSGYGPAYRRWFYDKLGLQLSGWFLSRKDEYRGEISGSQVYWTKSLGLIGLYNIHDWKYARGLLYNGISYLSMGTTDNRVIEIDSVYYRYRNHSIEGIDKELSFGNGIGIELTVWRLGIDLMGGVRFGYSFSGNSVMEPCLTLDGGLFYLF
jgi:hypothetical protein